jgi:hypothetical protein
MTLLFLAQLVLSLNSSNALADEAKLKVDTAAKEDTSILVHKGPVGGVIVTPTEYQIIEGTDDVLGDPSNDTQEALKSWKQACSDWKKELKANNGDRLIVANCGRPHVETEKVTFQKTDASTGTYRVKVVVQEASTPASPQQAVLAAPAPAQLVVPKSQ